MSIFKKTFRALGFGKDDEQESHVYTAKDISVATSRNTLTPATPDKTQENNNTTNDEAMPDILLDKVVELINSSFPDFVRSCIDIQSEKKYVSQQLDDSFKEYIAHINKVATERSEANIQASRKQLESDMNALQQKTAELEKQKTDIKNAQLSAERQKRALNEKVQDLESRIATLEADKEQYELENKSLLNKLKVAGVKQQELDDAQEEINRLLSSIQELKTKGIVPESTLQEIAEKSAAIEALQERIQYLSNENDELSTCIKTLNQEKEQLNNTLNAKESLTKQLSDEIAELVNQQEEATRNLATAQADKEAYTMLQTSLEESRKHCTELESALQEMRAEEMNNRNALESATRNLSEANNQNAILEQEHNATRTHLAEKTALIEQLQHNIEQLHEKLNDANTEREQLNNTQQQRIEQLEGELKECQTQLLARNEQPATVVVDNSELERANTLIAALKKQRQELIAQSASLRTQNKTLENQIATLQSKLQSADEDDSDSTRFDSTTDIDNALNWLMPVLPDQLEEEARRREEEERERREEEERNKQAEKERRASQEPSSQMSLW